jgi:pSer/pThr/pTyr-binding forkhead associated (FHA) protein
VTVDPARRRAGAGDEERTVILSRSVQSTVRLERVKPAGTVEVIDLDRPNLVLGRGHESDVKLRTPTASREHARIFFQNGHWTIASLERKTLYIDGARHAGGEFRLVNGMRVRLGDDEFVVIDSAGGDVGAHGSAGMWARVVSFVRGLLGRHG